MFILDAIIVKPSTQDYWITNPLMNSHVSQKLLKETDSHKSYLHVSNEKPSVKHIKFLRIID